nr:hypothetical protein [Burkholderia ubonensis]
MVKEIHQQTVSVIVDDFPNRCGAGSDYYAPRRHRFEHRPGQDEWVRQVNMGRRHLQHAKIVAMWQKSKEMYPGIIEAIPDLGHEMLAIRSFF